MENKPRRALRPVAGKGASRLARPRPPRRFGVLVCAALAMVALALTVPAVASAAVGDHTVSGVSPRGTTINLYDYWISSQGANDQSNPSNWENMGINAGNVLKFGEGMGTDLSQGDANAGNVNAWTGSSRPRTGIVSSLLGEDGFPTLSAALGSGSLSYLFDSSSFEGKTAYTDVDGLLQVDENGYYYYNSQENFAEFDESANSFTLYETWGVAAGGQSPDGQFFPFNSGDDVFSEGWGGSLNRKGVTSTDAEINHYFGLSMSTRFIQQYGGYTAAEGVQGRQQVTYNFSGDDDVWIYIDGVLVGDLGGIHNASSIQINFADGSVYVYDDANSNNQYDRNESIYQRTTIRQLFREAGVEGDYAWSGNTFADETYHTLDFFYLERGNTDSNMSLKYNLVNIPESGVVKVDQSGDALAGVSFTLRQADENYNVVEGGMTVTGTTDSNGEFIFTTENASGQEMPITLEQLQEQGGDYWVLTEDSAPEGYRSAGEMHLCFEDGVLLSSNEWETGAWSQPHVTATAPTTVREADNLSATHDADTGVMFAVVFQKGDDGQWYPVSGNAYDGWTVASGNGTSDVVAAAKDNKYQFVVGSGGAYEVTIDDLPGDITTYEYVLAHNGGNADEARYTVRYYWANADSIDQIGNGTQVVEIDANASAGYDGMERVFSVTLNVPNIKNELTLEKTDADTGTAMAGVEFKLYADEDRDGAADSTTPLATMTTDDNGELSVYSDTTKQILASGSYVLVETTPEGYEAGTDPIQIVVDDEGVHVDAGTASDNVSVETGIGSLVHSMKGFAAGDDVDSTLHDVTAQAQTAASYTGDGTAWTDANTAETHYQYDDKTEGLSYVRNDSVEDNGDATYTAQAGWSRLNVRQCLEHQGDDPVENKQDLGDQSLNALFTGDVTIHVTNEKIAQEVTTSEDDGTALMVQKTVSGADGAEAYEFELALTSDNGDAVFEGSGEGKTAFDGMTTSIDGLTNGESKTVSFGDVTFTKAGTYIFRVTEKNEDPAAYDGWTYDNDTTRTITVTVEKGADGKLQITDVSYDNAAAPSEDDQAVTNAAAFTNTYYNATGTLGGDGETSIVASKTLENGTLGGDDFTFNVTVSNGAETKTVATAKNAADGSITFPAIEYTTVGLRADADAGYAQRGQDDQGRDTYAYLYTVAEDTAGFAEGGLSTATAQFEVEVVVTDNGDGTLDVAVSYPEGSEDGLEFVNVYGADAEATLAVGGTKAYETNGLDGAPDIDGSYTYTLTGVDEAGNAAPLPDTTTTTNANGSFSFGEITYDIADLGGAESKTFTYTVTETGSVAGVENDASAETGKTFTVTLTDNGDGTISIDAEAQAAAGNQVSFTNTYDVESESSTVSDSLTVTKTLTGRDMVAGEFTFELVDTTSGEVVATGTNVAATDGEAAAVTLGAVTFTEPGEYHYTLREATGDAGGVSYSDVTFAVAAYVDDNGDGTMSVSWEFEDGSDQAAFENTYEATLATPIELVVYKELDGGTLEAGQFTFELTGSEGAPLPEGAADGKATATNATDGTVSFGSVTFTEAGEYDYTVTEVNDGQDGIAYDEDATRTIHVSVTDDGKGSLTAEVAYGDDGSAFVNSVVPAEGSGEDGGTGPNVPSEPDASGPDTGEGDASETIPATGDQTSFSVVLLAVALGICAVIAGFVLRSMARSQA